MNDTKFLAEIYPYDPENLTFTIPVSVGHYAEIHNPLDPSPIPNRDLAPNLVDYLDQCSAEIPNRYRLSIHVEVGMEAYNPEREMECRSSLSTYYKHETLRERSELRRRRLDAVKYLAISISCLAGYFIINHALAAAFFWGLFQEAVLIGGWLFMWEAISVSVIETDKYVQALKKFDRLSRTKIVFQYAAG